jgi:hypothetical protein
MAKRDFFLTLSGNTQNTQKERKNKTSVKSFPSFLAFVPLWTRVQFNKTQAM